MAEGHIGTWHAFHLWYYEKELNLNYMNSKKPKKLQPGDTVAIVSPSWAGPSVFPRIYEHGLGVLKGWGLKIKEFPTARATSDEIKNNPKMRAQDINEAFADPEVKAIFSSIGGDDSVRILPFLDKEIISKNPKILMGYSDSTTFLVFANLIGLVTFNGPSIMAGFSQMDSLPGGFKQHVHDILFNPAETYQYPSFGVYTDGYADWADAEKVGKVKGLESETGIRTIHGVGKVSGQLFGGCIEVLEFLKGTDFWPEKDFWEGKVLFLETSEEKPSISCIRRVLRNYGVQGIFEKINGIIFARARDYSDEEKNKLDEMIKDVVQNEFGNTALSIMTNAEFGHSDPQIVLPLGVMIEMDMENNILKLLEKCVE
jgi:muramoyltetrapeptide carboxypeptidase LdcA involved in peptidoglycan recycling